MRESVRPKGSRASSAPGRFSSECQSMFMQVVSEEHRKERLWVSVRVFVIDQSRGGEDVHGSWLCPKAEARPDSPTHSPDSTSCNFCLKLTFETLARELPP